MARFNFIWVATFCCCLSSARADSGDWVLSLESVVGSYDAAGLDGSVRYGLSDVFSLELGSGGRFLWGANRARFGGAGSLELVAALDVFSWVPEFTFGWGAVFANGSWEPSLHSGLKLRWVLDFSWSVFAGAEGVVSLHDSLFNGATCIGISYLLD